MSIAPNSPHLLAVHTFGRQHMEPPPLPSSVQIGQSTQNMQMGADTYQPAQAHAGDLPSDFDHLVRSVGEW
ncbi:MAG: hypothetical protein ACI4QS_08990 [Comamonas sp.]